MQPACLDGDAFFCFLRAVLDMTSRSISSRATSSAVDRDRDRAPYLLSVYGRREEHSRGEALASDGVV